MRINKPLEIAAAGVMDLRRIQIEPTNRCNYKCGYCRRSYWRRTEGDMSLERYRILLEKLPVVSRIHLQGVGEPLLNKDLPEMIRHTRFRGARVGITTNASLLDLKWAQALLDAGINRINLSIDTLDPEKFHCLRPGVPLERVLANIKTLAQVRANGRYQNTELALAVVAGNSNIVQFSSIVIFAAEHGLDEVYAQNLNSGFLPKDRAAALRVDGERYAWYQEATKAAEALAVSLGLRFYAPALVSPNYLSHCQWPFYGCNISWDGYVAPCCLQPDPDVLHFGNLFETDFDQIWCNPEYGRFRGQVLADCAPVCADCPDRYGQMWHPAAAPFGRVSPIDTSHQ